jgi:hypothetical protein
MSGFDLIKGLFGFCFLVFLAWLLIGSIGVCFVAGPLVPATVVDRAYAPSSTSTGFDSKGKMITTSHSESYTVIVEIAGGFDGAGVHSVTTSGSWYAHTQAGNPVTVMVRHFLGFTRYTLADTPAVEGPR